MASKELDLRVYKLDRDLEQVIHNIVVSLKNDKEMTNKWNLGPKQDHWFNVKIQGPEMELRVECLKGGWRTQRLDVNEMQQYAKEVVKLLGKFEKAVRSEFKERTGKALRWGKGKEYVNYEPVALNNLYKFYAFKSGPVRVSVDRQEWNEDVPSIKRPKTNEEDIIALYKDLEFPEKWK